MQPYNIMETHISSHEILPNFPFYWNFIFIWYPFYNIIIKLPTKKDKTFTFCSSAGWLVRYYLDWRKTNLKFELKKIGQFNNFPHMCKGSLKKKHHWIFDRGHTYPTYPKGAPPIFDRLRFFLGGSVFLLIGLLSKAWNRFC